MDRRFPLLAEVARALVVLALILLNLSYAAPASAVGAGYQASAAVQNCGFSDIPDHAGHAPCHACRSGTDAVLPPPPTDAEPICIDLVDVRYIPFAYARVYGAPLSAHRSRGPPNQA